MKEQSGATSVEFALVLLVFLMFFLGILDFARMLWTWNAANEATRWGARAAVVCDKGAPAVQANMKKFLPQLTNANITIDWYDIDGNISTACKANDSLGTPLCAGVNVQITNLNYHWISPILGMSNFNIPMPAFSTYLPREMMWTSGAHPTEYAAVCS
jgi:Flp pilus assembly protein TadG